MIAIKIPIERINEIEGQTFDGFQKFGIVTDINGYNFISIQEQNQCNLQWIKDIVPTTFIPKIETLLK